MHYPQFPPVGARLAGDTINFVVWAPEKDEVSVSLEGRGESIKMNKDEFGFFSASLAAQDSVLRYWFDVDGKKIPDPASRSQESGVHGPSSFYTGAFEWSDQNWRGLPLQKMIQYEIHVGTFTEEGTFEGVIKQLEYLQDLGVNTIELMPIAQFPGERNWGYDGVFPFAVQNSYGGAEGLKQLVNAAHAKGMAVVLDVVYNHLGPEGNYLAEFGPYLTDTYKTGWGQAINFDGPLSDGVRHFYLENARMWLDEFHVDGLRLDAVHAIYDYSAKHFMSALQDVADGVEAQTGRTKVLIAELDLNNPRYIDKREAGGYGLAGQWCDEFHHALHTLVTGEKDGYYSDFSGVSDLALAMQNSYVYTGQYSAHRKKFFGVMPTQNPYHQFVVFSQNHDQIGNRMNGDRLSTIVSFEKLKLTAATILLSPQIPLLFMGEEYGETNPFQYFANHGEEELLESVREGRKKEFAHFKWEGEVPDPFDEEVFKACKLSWDLETGRRKTLHSFYRQLILLRTERRALQNQKRSSLAVITKEDGVIVIERSALNEKIYLYFNYSETTMTLPARPDTSLHKILDSSGLHWDGQGELAPVVIGPGEQIAMQPWSVIVFEKAAE